MGLLQSEHVNTNVQPASSTIDIDFGPQGTFGSVDFGHGAGPYSTANCTTIRTARATSTTTTAPSGTRASDAAARHAATPCSSTRRCRCAASSLGYARRQDRHRSRASSITAYTSSAPGGSDYSDAGGGAGESGLCDETDRRRLLPAPGRRPGSTTISGVSAPASTSRIAGSRGSG